MSDEIVSKFMTHMILLSNLDHPNILKFYECFQDAKRFYIVTELCWGGDLFTYMEQYVDMEVLISEKDAADITVSLLSTLNYLHDNEIICMDLKPENVLFLAKESFNIKIIDFHHA